MDQLKNIFLTSRPKQQFKNILVIIPFVLSANLWLPLSFEFIADLSLNVLLGLVSFILGSWFIYILNDSIDKNVDKDHPEKSKRPITSNKLSQKNIITLSVFTTSLSIYFGYLISLNFFITLLIYLILMSLYSFGLKKLFFIDVVSIAFGYMLRVYAGATIVVYILDESANVSIWLILCTGFASLFVLSIKRFSELKGNVSNIRSSLERNIFYSKFLNLSINFNEILTYISYSLYCISVNFTSLFRGNTPSDSSLLLTIPFVILGMRKFKKNSLESSFGDQPEEIIFNSNFIKIIFICWVLFSSLIIYFRN